MISNEKNRQYVLKTCKRNLILGERTLIMGIINVTPDSFSDGGRFISTDAAVAEGIAMAQDGADILDIGGESSRPGSEAVTTDEEVKRVIPVIHALARHVRIPISIDTTKAIVAGEAIRNGAEIVNDISAMTFDSTMSEVIAQTGAAVILMHMRGIPKDMQEGDLAYRSLPGDIITYLGERIRVAEAAGIDPEAIMIDPGLGFGKTPEDNLKLIKHLADFGILKKPLVTGVSRKSFIGKVTGGLPALRREGTAAAVTVTILNGTHIARVHDVKVMKKVAAMADAIFRA